MDISSKYFRYCTLIATFSYYSRDGKYHNNLLDAAETMLGDLNKMYQIPALVKLASAYMILSNWTKALTLIFKTSRFRNLDENNEINMLITNTDIKSMRSSELAENIMWWEYKTYPDIVQFDMMHEMVTNTMRTKQRVLGIRCISFDTKCSVVVHICYTEYLLACLCLNNIFKTDETYRNIKEGVEKARNIYGGEYQSTGPFNIFAWFYIKIHDIPCGVTYAVDTVRRSTVGHLEKEYRFSMKFIQHVLEAILTTLQCTIQ